MLSEPFSCSLFALCSGCYRKLSRARATPCERCLCALYCGAACRRAHWLGDSQSGEPAHADWCARMRQFRQRGRQLADELPFDFAEATTADDFDAAGLARFLLQRGLLGRGMWRRECYAWLDVHSDLGPPLPGELDPGQDPYALPPEEAAALLAPADVPPSAPGGNWRPLCNWRDYYSLRRLPLSSPACVLLQCPLTLYHILFNLLPSDAPSLHARLLGSTDEAIVLHLPGAEKEAELAPAFKELPALAPWLRFELALIGKELSPSVHKSVLVSDRLKVTMHRGLYHKVAPELPKPHLVVAFNAGFAAGVSWPATLEFLKKQSAPTYVTDYCEYSMELSGAVCSKLRTGTLAPQRVNPFRSPLRLPNEQLDLPSYSNAFVAELVYPSA